MREIKFRAWVGKKFEYVELPGIGNSGAELLRDTVPYPELQQYTGLKDKNGVEVYEGDIVRHESEFDDDPVSYLVEFEYGSFHIGPYPEMLTAYASDGEVVGNIYESPGLV